MNILFITKHGLETGGVAVVLGSLSAGLKKLGIDVLVYGHDDSARGGRLPNGIPCVHGPLPKFGLFGKAPAKAIAELCRRQKFDLIHAHSIYRGGHAARLVKQQIGLPYVLTSHGDIITGASRRIRRRKVRRRCRAILRDADAVTHLTPVMAAEAQRLCDVRDKSCVICNGIDLGLWRGNARPVPGDYVFTVGRHEPQKGFHVLMDAFALLAKRNFGPALVIAGEGPFTAELHQQARRLGLKFSDRLEDLADATPGTVCFPGRVAEQTKRDLFAGCRFAAFTSQQNTPESFGIVQIEAFAAGKAIICSDIPASAHLVADGKNGLIVPATDVNAWAGGMERLAGDEALRNGIEAANRLEAEKYDWPDIARRYAEVYRRVLQHASPARPEQPPP